MKLCTECGGPIDRGQSGERNISPNRTRCLICLTAARLTTADLRTHRQHAPRRIVECACGCGRVGPIMARGMVSVCYQRGYRAGRFP
jgi:hypothetical protein